MVSSSSAFPAASRGPRFRHTVHPAIARKRSIDGTAIKFAGSST